MTETTGHGIGSLQAHPLRATLVQEAHARPFQAARSPRRFLHFAFASDPSQAEGDRNALLAFCRDQGLAGPLPQARHHYVSTGTVALRWERHSEFTTYTWETADDGAGISLARQLPMQGLPQPGPLVAAIDLRLQRERAEEAWDGFDEASLAIALVDGGAAIAATDFRPDAEGYVRIVVEDRELTPIRAGALVQRLLEMETYRLFALMGLPEARRLAPEVDEIERELVRIAEAMTSSDTAAANQELLQRLTQLAARLEAGAAKSLYRFAASRAYYEIVHGRLEAIREESLPGQTSFSTFMSRRLAPAMRTCTTMEERQANLSRKLARAAQLLRARVDIELEHQSRELLESMNARTTLQLRLQKTVEALSVAAASYYVVGLVRHGAALLPGLGVEIDPELVAAGSIPIVVAAITAFFLTRTQALRRGR